MRLAGRFRAVVGLSPKLRWMEVEGMVSDYQIGQSDARCNLADGVVRCGCQSCNRGVAKGVCINELASGAGLKRNR